MGMQTIQIEWNITIKHPHQVLVIRHAGMIFDKLEVLLDGNSVILVGGLVNGQGKKQFFIDNSPVELQWVWNWTNGDPETITLLHDNKVIAQYNASNANNIKKSPISLDKVVVQLGNELEKIDVATEEVHIPNGVIIKVKRSRTIEHTININWSTTRGGSFDLGIKEIVGASINGEITQAKGRTYQQSETMEYEVELNGEKSNRYQLVWVDIWRKGFAELIQGNQTQVVPFQFRELTELRVIPVSSTG